MHHLGSSLWAQVGFNTEDTTLNVVPAHRRPDAVVTAEGGIKLSVILKCFLRFPGVY